MAPTDEKIQAIVDAPSPKDKQQLQSFLGMPNHYHKFLPNLSTEIKDLYLLLKKNTPFVWSEVCENAFQKSKSLLVKSHVMEFFDPNKPIIVAADASPYGLGAVLSHEIQDSERPVLYASSSLSPEEKNYSQLHREALSVIYAVKKFHKYLYGNKFTIYTDSQSLKEIFHPNKKTPAVAAARLQRWAVYLSMYKYTIVHKSAKKMAAPKQFGNFSVHAGRKLFDGLIILNLLPSVPMHPYNLQN